MTMKRTFVALALLFAPLGVHAQTTTQVTTKVVATCGTASYTAGKMAFPTQDTTGAACSSAGGGGGGDATAANQTLQITQETAINTILGTVTASPTANTIADRLKTINTTLGTPATAAAQTTLQTSVGAPGDTACASGAVSCALAPASRRSSQRRRTPLPWLWWVRGQPGHLRAQSSPSKVRRR